MARVSTHTPKQSRSRPVGHGLFRGGPRGGAPGRYGGIIIVLIITFLAFKPVGRVDAVVATLTGYVGMVHRLLMGIETSILGPAIPVSAQRAAEAAERSVDLRQREVASAVARDSNLKSRPGVSANIIFHNSAEAWFDMDRGLRDGVATGDPVTCGDALAGIVESASASTSRVRYLWHRGVRLCVRSGETRAVCVGAGGGLLRVEACSGENVNDNSIFIVNESPDGDALDLAAGFQVGLYRSRGEGRPAVIEPDAVIRSEQFLNVMVRTRGVAAKETTVGPVELWVDGDTGPGGDVSPGRCSALLAGAGSHTTNGAAVTAGGWLLGRVARRGGPTARVEFVNNPGWIVEAILLSDTGPPMPMGRLRTRVAREGEILLEPLDRNVKLDPLAAGMLMTGAAEPGVPKGLCLGMVTIKDGMIALQPPFEYHRVRYVQISAREP